MCKKYYPLSMSYHSRWLQQWRQQPVCCEVVGALIWRGTGSVMIAVPDRPRAKRQPVTSAQN